MNHMVHPQVMDLHYYFFSNFSREGLRGGLLKQVG